MNDKKILIAYYSRTGENYADGRIVNLPIGNTAVIADKIKKLTGGDLFEIKTVKPYPKNYTETTNVASKELHENARPELSKYLSDISDYDFIFLGFPNWWGTMPMPVYTFLESCNFNVKTIIPFCTHEGSGMANSVKDIKSVCPSAIVNKGIAIRGTDVKHSDNLVERLVLQAK